MPLNAPRSFRVRATYEYTVTVRPEDMPTPADLPADYDFNVDPEDILSVVIAEAAQAGRHDLSGATVTAEVTEL